MKHILLLNLHQKYEGFANGALTKLLLEEAKKFFLENGFEVRESVAEEGYDVQEELEKFRWADSFFVQSPVYWMGLPWLGKKYLDEILSGGNGTVTFKNDGRDPTDASKKYGSGGLLGGKSYMLSFTYNCPTSEFDNKEGFFEGMSVDEANVALHKAFQFCGANKLATYSVHDVYSGNLNIDKAKEELREVLKANFC